MSNKKTIINPNKISSDEQKFLQKVTNTTTIKYKSDIDSISYKKVMLSMPETFFNEINAYLKKNPTEGSRSSFIVRVVAEYLKEKHNFY